MNWTGGTKNRFRSRGEINCQKASFHQQRRLVLAESLEPKDAEKQQPFSNMVQTNQNLPCTPDNDLFGEGNDDGDKTKEFPLTPFAFINEDSKSSASMFGKTQENNEKEVASTLVQISNVDNSANYSPTSEPSFSSKNSKLNSPLSESPILPQCNPSPNCSGHTKKLLKRKFMFPICQHVCKCKIIRVVRKVKVRDSFTQTDS